MTCIVLQATSWIVTPHLAHQVSTGTRWDTYVRDVHQEIEPWGPQVGPGWRHRCRRLYFLSESVYGHRSTWLTHEDVQWDAWLDSQWSTKEASSMMNVELT